MSKDGLPKWAEVQKRTFTNWVNVRLAERGTKIDDLAADFSDGLRLIALLEIITEKKLPKHNREIKRLPQKTENVSIALQFLKDQGIKMVGIGADDIVDGRAKLILGLIWTIIQKYQIQKGKTGGGSAKDELLGWVNKAIPTFNVRNFKGDWRDGRALSAIIAYLKPGSIDLNEVGDDALQNASRAVGVALKELSIPAIVAPEDMVSDDADDLSIMTYISYFRDYDQSRQGSSASASVSLKSSGALTSSGTSLPEVSLTGSASALPAVSLTTSASALPAVSLTASASSTSSSPVATYSDDDEIAPSKCDVYGPGLEGADVGKRNICIIQAVDKQGEDLKTGGASFDAKVTGPEGEDIKLPPIKDNKDGTYTVVYSPNGPGTHKIELSYKSVPLPGSPWTITAKGTARVGSSSPLVSSVGSPGPTRAALASSSDTEVDVVTATAKDTEVNLSGLKSPNAEGFLSFVVGTKGKQLPLDIKYIVEILTTPDYDDVPSKLVENGDGTVTVLFKPTKSGNYRIEVQAISAKLDKKAKVKDSPFKFAVELEESAPVPTKAAEDKGDSIDAYAEETKVDFGNLGNPDEHGKISFLVTTKGGKPLPQGWRYDPMVLYRAEDLEITPDVHDNKDGTYKVAFKLEKSGAYLIDLTLISADKKSKAVKGSPFKISLEVQQVEAKIDIPTGKGKGRKGKKGDGDSSSSDSSDDEDKKKKKGGIAQFVKDVVKDVAEDIENLVLSLSKKAKADFANFGEPTDDGEFAFSFGHEGSHLAEGATYVATATYVQDKSDVPIKVIDNNNGTYRLLFKPTKSGNYSFAIGVSHKGKIHPIAGSPYNLNITVAEGNELDETAEGFSIEPSGLSKLNEDGEVGFVVKNDSGKALPDGVEFVTKITYEPTSTDFKHRIVKHEDGGFGVFFAPRKPGAYTILVDLKDKEGKTSPVNGTPITLTLNVNAIENAARQVTVDLAGLSAEPTREGNVSFLVGKYGKKLPEKSFYTVKINLEGEDIPAKLHEKEPGLYEVSFRPTKSGKYVIDISVVDEDGTSVRASGSPFEVIVTFKPVLDLAVESAAKSLVIEPRVEAPSASGEFSFRLGRKRDLPEGSYFTSKVIFIKDQIEVKSSVVVDADGNFQISFVPTQSGDYSVDISLVDKNGLGVSVKGSPFKINVSLKPVAPVLDPAVELAAENTYVDVPEAGTPTANGEFHIVIDGPRRRFPGGAHYTSKVIFVADKSEVKSSVEKDDDHDNAYKVVFTPHATGEYLVEVFLVDKNGVPAGVKGSPFKVNITLKAVVDPAAEQAAKSTLVDTEIGKPNAAGEFGLVVDPPRRGLPAGAKYVSKITSVADNSEVPSAVVPDSDGSYKITFKPTASGEYSVEVSIVDKSDIATAVRGSPFKVKVTVKPTIDPAVSAVAEVLSLGPAGDANSRGDVAIPVDLGNTDVLPEGSELLSKVFPADDPKSELSSDVKRERGGAGYKVVFRPPASNTYLVDIKLIDKNDKVVAAKSSPFKVRVDLKPVLDPAVEVAASNTNVDLSGLKGDPSQSDFGFTIDAPRRFPSDAKYKVNVVALADDSELEATVKQIGDREYKVTFKPTIAGDYSVDVAILDKNDLPAVIKGSPFKVNVQLKPVVDPAAELAAHNTTVDVSDLSKPLNPSKGEYGLIIGAPRRLPYGAKYTSNVYLLPSKKEVESVVSTDSDGSENVLFRPPESGEYLIEVFLADKNGILVPINGSPFKVHIQLKAAIEPAVEIAAENTEVDLSDLIEPGSGTRGFVLAGPRRGLPAGAQYIPKVINVSDNSVVPCQIAPDSDGQYNVIFNPEDSGAYSIEVLVADKNGTTVPVKGSPFRANVVVKPAVDPAVLQAAQKTVVDTSSLGEPNQNGEYGLAIGAPGKKLPAGAYYVTKVVLVQEESETEIRSSVVTEADGSFKVIFKPFASGEHSIDILLVDKNEASVPIQGSPFNVTIDLDAIRIARAEKALTLLAKATKLRLHALGREFSDDGEVMFEIIPAKLPPKVQYVPKIVFSQEKSGELPVRILDEDGLLRVIFTPPRSGEYLTQVWIADEFGVSVPVNDTPHSTTINIPPPPPPPEPEIEAKDLPLEDLISLFTNVGAEELPDGGYAFLIGYKEKKLPDGYYVDVRVNYVSDGSDVEAKISDGGDGITRVEFAPPYTGEYYVSAGLVDAEGNGAEIAGSPYTIVINKPSPDEEKEAKAFAGDTFVDFTGFDRPRYDGTTSFLIGTRGKNVPPSRFRYEPKIISVQTHKAVIGAKAIDQKNGTFKVSFAPPTSGDYYIEVELVSNENEKRYTVKGSPFTVNVNLARSPAPSPLPLNPGQRKYQPPSPNPNKQGWATVGGGITSSVPKPAVPPWVIKTGKTWKPPGATSPSPVASSVPAPHPSQPKYSYPVSKPASTHATLARTGGGSAGAAAKKGVAGTLGIYPVSAYDIGLAEGESFDVSLEGPNGILPVDITYKGDAIFEVAYTPVVGGRHKIQFIRNNNLALEDTIEVEEVVDAGESLAVTFSFVLETRFRGGKPKGKGGDKVIVRINGPRGPVNTVQVQDLNNGKYNVSYSLPGHGDYEITVTLNGKNITGSPWKVSL